MRFFHAADIHLDIPHRNLVEHEPPTIETLRRASRHAFERLVDLCILHIIEDPERLCSAFVRI